jgi:hypothetical protein
MNARPGDRNVLIAGPLRRLAFSDSTSTRSPFDRDNDRDRDREFAMPRIALLARRRLRPEA